MKWQFNTEKNKPRHRWWLTGHDKNGYLLYPDTSDPSWTWSTIDELMACMRRALR